MSSRTPPLRKLPLQAWDSLLYHFLNLITSSGKDLQARTTEVIPPWPHRPSKKKKKKTTAAPNDLLVMEVAAASAVRPRPPASEAAAWPRPRSPASEAATQQRPAPSDACTALGRCGATTPTRSTRCGSTPTSPRRRPRT